METMLDTLAAQLTRTAAREMDRRLVWDMVLAHADGVDLRDVVIAEWPDGSRSLSERCEIGEAPKLLGPRHKSALTSDSTHLHLRVV